MSCPRNSFQRRDVWTINHWQVSEVECHVDSHITEHQPTGTAPSESPGCVLGPSQSRMYYLITPQNRLSSLCA